MFALRLWMDQVMSCHGKTCGAEEMLFFVGRAHQLFPVSCRDGDLAAEDPLLVLSVASAR